MIGWHHRLDGHEFEQAVGDGEGQGSLVCCSPWGHKELDMNKQLNDYNQVTSTPISTILVGSKFLGIPSSNTLL